MRIQYVFTVLVLLVAAACGGGSKPSAPATPEATPTPDAFDATFSYQACEMAIPDGQHDNIACGRLTVLEDREETSSRTISLAVAILKAAGPKKPDPVIYLSGGPGGSALQEDLQQFTTEFAAPIQSARDIVFFDQRGVGLSDPALDCGELDLISAADFGDVDPGDIDFDPYRAAFADCRNRLLELGIAIEDYNSAESARDIIDLADALDYEQMNLYGVSYGTRLALTAMRDAPERIRSAVLDSTLPLQANVYADPTFEEALNALFTACDANATCASLAPDLRGTFFSVVDRLDAEPAVIRLPDDSGLLVTGDDFIDFVFDAMYDTFYLPYLPADIVRVANGDNGPLAYLASYAYYDLGTSLGLYLSVQCVEEIPFNTVERVAQTSQLERIGAFSRNDVLARKADCEVWGVPGATPVENDPVVSDVPTLILSGEFDPITPPSYARLAASTLANSYVHVLPGYGHGVLYEGCPMELMATFLERPASGPDAACVQDLRAEFFE